MLKKLQINSHPKLLGVGINKFIVITALILMFFSALAGFLIAAITKLALLEIFLSLTPTVPLLSETNILVLGLDGKAGMRSDTIMVAHVNPSQREVSIVSIPRDTLVVLPGRGLDKINHAYVYGGIELTRRAVMDFLQVDIPHYITVNIGGLSSLIDELGGITIDVERRMYYVDYAGELYINLQPGRQRLSGREALGYLRYRQDGGDLVRISRQQKFLEALGEEFAKKENILKTPHLFLSLFSHVGTNLTPKDTLGLSLGLRSAYEGGRVHMISVPGLDLMVDGIYYWKPDYTALEGIVEKYLGKKKLAGSG